MLFGGDGARQRTQGRRGEVLPVNMPYDRKEIARRAQLGPPTSAEEYLLRVRLEAERLPKVTTAASAKEKRRNDEAKTTNVVLSTDIVRESNLPTWHETVQAKEELLPHPQWTDDALASFATAREYIESRREEADSGLDASDSDLPDINDEDGWFMFCFEGDGHPPLLSIMLRMDPMTVQSMLAYHVDWLSEEMDDEIVRFPTHRAVWLYAILVCIDMPLNSDVASDIRRLLVLCTAVRSRLNRSSGEERVLASLNTLIAITGRFFHQNEISQS